MIRLASFSLFALVAAGASAQTVEVDVGLDAPLVVDASVPPRIAYFIGGTNNSALQTSIAGAEAGAAEIGATIDIFDANWDANRMVGQMQTGLLSGYTAWVVATPEGNQVCDMITEVAPRANIPVAVVLVPICGTDAADGDDLHVPGMMTFVGGNETPRAFRAIVELAAEQNPGEVQVGVLTGPDVNPLTRNLLAMVAEVQAEHPGFDVVSTLSTDFSVPQSLEKAATMLQAHPEIDVIIAQYSNITRGVILALEEAGLAGRVRVYDSGGSRWSVDQIRAGTLQASSGVYHFTNAKAAVLAIGDAWAGRPVPHVILNDGAPLLEGQEPGEPPLITVENVDVYQAEVE
jgi:ribose transport system substrate-binding protein